jgi:hypothetical protein
VVQAEIVAAIRDRWIPRLEQALAGVTLVIEEQELAHAIGLRMATGAAPHGR